jgi:hypothetical protein
MVSILYPLTAVYSIHYNYSLQPENITLLISEIENIHTIRLIPQTTDSGYSVSRVTGYNLDDWISIFSRVRPPIQHKSFALSFWG